MAWHLGARVTETRNSPGNLIPDVLLHHKWRPNVRRPADGVVINSQSWSETYDVERRKPASVFRIFFLGDSTTWGHALHERKMVKLVERELNDAYRGRGVRFEAINTGTSSYSNFQYYLLSKEVLPAYAPDLVVLDVDVSELPNDYYDPVLSPRSTRAGSRSS